MLSLLLETILIESIIELNKKCNDPLHLYSKSTNTVSNTVSCDDFDDDDDYDDEYEDDDEYDEYEDDDEDDEDTPDYLCFIVDDDDDDTEEKSDNVVPDTNTTKSVDEILDELRSLIVDPVDTNSKVCKEVSSKTTTTTTPVKKKVPFSFSTPIKKDNTYNGYTQLISTLINVSGVSIPEVGSITGYKKSSIPTLLKCMKDEGLINVDGSRITKGPKFDSYVNKYNIK